MKISDQGEQYIALDKGEFYSIRVFSVIQIPNNYWNTLIVVKILT